MRIIFREEDPYRIERCRSMFNTVRCFGAKGHKSNHFAWEDARPWPSRWGRGTGEYQVKGEEQA